MEFFLSNLEWTTLLKVMPELLLGFSIKLFCEEGEISWSAFSDYYLSGGWFKAPETVAAHTAAPALEKIRVA